ncbi:MAG TPA: carbohydrate ABC transporter permease [Candidatus Limiplasma sp.]|nr:carbohydrate ABC transporter permease [Candidatus Limiplasma sp.]HPR77699.1 carbohydrate ABC transporter permease [Candidatus Limiplasma sp.]
MKRPHNDVKRFQRFATAALAILAVFALLPILLIAIASVTDENVLVSSGYSFLPAKLSLDSYYYMVKQSQMILRAYGITISVTLLGTLGSVLLTTTLAYPMARPDFKYRNLLSFFVFFTMLFNGGVVSSYIMWTRVFAIKNTIWALIVPNYLVTAFNVFLVRNYYTNSIPHAMVESAQIDGAGELQIFFKIMLPMAVPTVATISLFTGMIYWNDWVNGLYFISDAKMYGLQNLLIRIMNNIQFLKVSSNTALLGTQNIDLPGSSVRMAMAMIGILPILILFPFVQKYFVKGVVLGAVKG